MAAGDREAALAVVMGTSALARLFRVSTVTIREWRQAGMPSDGSRFNVAACIQWRRKRDQEAAKARGGPLADERRRLIREQAKGQRLENEARARELLPADEVRAHLTALARIVGDELGKLPGGVAPDLVDVTDPALANRILAAACRQIRGAVAESWQRYAASLASDDDGHGD